MTELFRHKTIFNFYMNNFGVIIVKTTISQYYEKQGHLLLLKMSYKTVMNELLLTF